MALTSEGASTSRDESFVKSILARIQVDKGLKAALKRADNPSTEFMSWEHIARFGVNLEIPSQRIPFTMVCAAMARSNASENGALSLGKAIAQSYPDGVNSSPAVARIRRLLACHDIEEVSTIIRPILSLIYSRNKAPLDFVRLLGQLLRFSFHPERVKAQWAQEFYGSDYKKAS